MSAKASKSGKKGTRRPVEFVTDPDSGEPIQGLRFHKGKKLYYRIEPKQDGEKRAKTFYYPRNDLIGVAYQRYAVLRHRYWLQGQEPPSHETITITQPYLKDNMFDQGEDDWSYFVIHKNGTTTAQIGIARKDLCNWVRDQILTPSTRLDFATDVGIPELAYLDRIRPQESLPLIAIGDLYLVKRKVKVKPQTACDNKRYWTTFRENVQVATVGEITPQHIDNYYETLYEKYEREELSSAWIRAHVSLVGTVLRYASHKHADNLDLSRVLRMIRGLELPDKVELNPKPIEPADFHKLLKACESDLRYRTLLHLALNACYYPIDCSQVTIDEIDLTTNVIRRVRTKKRIGQICCLWTRTADLIREYLASKDFKDHHPDPDDRRLFGWKRGRITHYFRKYRKAVKLNDIEFNQIRDAAYTWAATGAIHGDDANLDSARILAGHKIEGEIDAYFRRHESHVRACTARIEAAFFADEQPQTQQPGQQKPTSRKGINPREKKGGLENSKGGRQTAGRREGDLKKFFA